MISTPKCDSTVRQDPGMDRHGESPPSSPSLATGVHAVLGQAGRLVELQGKLTMIEFQQLARGIVPALIGFSVGLTLVVPAMALLLGSGILVLVQNTELTIVTATALVGAVTLCSSLILFSKSWRQLLGISVVFQRSTQELNQNLRCVLDAIQNQQRQ